MTGEEDEQEIVRSNENSTNIVRGKVFGAVVQFDTVADLRCRAAPARPVCPMGAPTS